jgi:hypothetical protein
MRVFRDQASVSVNPAVWSTIEKALSASDYFILLASPDSASSEWVTREVDYWLRNSSPARLLIVLTEGQIAGTRALAISTGTTRPPPKFLA